MKLNSLVDNLRKTLTVIFELHLFTCFVQIRIIRGDGASPRNYYARGGLRSRQVDGCIQPEYRDTGETPVIIKGIFLDKVRKLDYQKIITFYIVTILSTLWFEPKPVNKYLITFATHNLDTLGFVVLDIDTKG